MWNELNPFSPFLLMSSVAVACSRPHNKIGSGTLLRLLQSAKPRTLLPSPLQGKCKPVTQLFLRCSLNSVLIRIDEAFVEVAQY